MTAVQEYVEGLLDRGLLGGIGLIEEDGRVELAASGLVAPAGRPLTTDAIVRIQSMTKTVTTIATLRLIEAGRLGLDSPVAEWLPELASPRVLRTPASELDETVDLARPITVRHLMNLTCGHGIQEGTPYHDAQVAAGVDAIPGPITRGSDEWLASLATLPLAHQPGEGWRYHHGFMLLGILLRRLTGRPLGEHLAEDVFGPLGMVDSGSWAHDPVRLPAAYSVQDRGPVVTEPAGGGHYAGDPGFDASHGELVSTASDWLRLARMLRDGGLVEGRRFLSEASVRAMTSGQVPDAAKSPESLGAGFWQDATWGFGVSIDTGPRHPGRFGWAGGQGTHYTVDPASGRITILLTQAEMGPLTWAPVFEFQDLSLRP